MATSSIPAALTACLFIACAVIQADGAAVSETATESDDTGSYAKNLLDQLINTDIMTTNCDDLEDTLRCDVKGKPGITIVVKKSAAVYINNKEGMDDLLQNLNSCLNLDKFK